MVAAGLTAAQLTSLVLVGIGVAGLAGAATMANRRGLKIALIATALGVAAACGLLRLRYRTPSVAPDFAVPDLAGQAVRLSAFRGQVVLLNIWTTWCPPCREEMPSMERLYQRLRDRGFALLAVSEDEGGAAVVEPFVRQLGLTFPVLVDPEQQVGSLVRGVGVPGVLPDRSGRTHRGAGHRPARLGNCRAGGRGRAPARCITGWSAGALTGSAEGRFPSPLPDAYSDLEESA